MKAATLTPLRRKFTHATAGCWPAPLLPLLRRWPGLLTVAAVAAGKVRPLAAPGEGGSAGAERRSMPERPGAHANVAPPPPLRDTR
jgi:hypothetical protein